MLKVFEAFAGYGSQSISLHDCNIEHEVVGISEIDPDAIIAYAAIRFDLDNYKLIDNPSNKSADKTIYGEVRTYLKSKNVGWDFKKNKSSIDRMKKSKLEKLYFADQLTHNYGDISIIDSNELPDFDYFTYSFPCQDISVAGLGKGLEKGETRSGLLYECEKVIEAKKPKYLLMENVKNLVGKKFKPDFDKWCEYLEGLGYKNFYKVLNAKDFGVAQNRERVFMVSILKTAGIDFPKGFEPLCTLTPLREPLFNFPTGWKLDKKLKDFLEDKVDEKYYISDYKFILKHNEGNECGRLEGVKWGKYQDNIKRVYDINAYAPSLTTMQGGHREPKILETLRIRKLTPKECFRLMGLKDEYIDRIQSTGLSNSAQYKLAGNSIVVNVLNEIHKELFKC